MDIKPVLSDVSKKILDTIPISEQDKSTLIKSINNVIKQATTKTLQTTINSLPFYVLIVDSEHRIAFANEAVKKELNIDPKKIIGKYCPQVIHNSDTPIPECPLEEANKKGHSIEIEYYDTNIDKWYISAVYKIEGSVLDSKTLYFHMLYDITERKKTELKLKESIEKINKIFDQGIQAMISLVEKRDPYTAGHQKRVSQLSQAIAEKLSLPQDKINSVHYAGVLHDIGKMSIPVEILNKPGKLRKTEFNVIKDHPYEGYLILKNIDFPWPVAEITLQHHERLNGSGYPNQLQGQDILIEAKILAVADVVEAMSSHRPYRSALGINAALEEIYKNIGILYDKDVVNVCLDLFRVGNFQFNNY